MCSSDLVGPEASAERSEGTMEARQGRNPAGGSMRSTTARPAMLLGRGRPRKSPKFQKVKILVVNCDLMKIVSLAVTQHQEKK